MTLAEVFRFAAEDTLVLRVEIENTTDTVLRFDPSGLAVRVGPNIYPAARVDAAGEVAPHTQATGWMAVACNAGGSPANLSARNSFFVLVPSLP